VIISEFFWLRSQSFELPLGSSGETPNSLSIRSLVRVSIFLIVVFWIVTPCSLIDEEKRFGEHAASIFRSHRVVFQIYYILYIQIFITLLLSLGLSMSWGWKKRVPPKPWYAPTLLHTLTTRRAQSERPPEKLESLCHMGLFLTVRSRFWELCISRSSGLI
jgi:hypothetical protein